MQSQELPAGQFLNVSDLLNSNYTGFVWDQMTPSLRPLHLKEWHYASRVKGGLFDTTWGLCTQCKRENPLPVNVIHSSSKLKCILCVNLRSLAQKRFWLIVIFLLRTVRRDPKISVRTSAPSSMAQTSRGTATSGSRIMVRITRDTFVSQVNGDNSPRFRDSRESLRAELHAPGGKLFLPPPQRCCWWHALPSWEEGYLCGGSV